ncbi:MAG TPA: glycosyltransferase [Thermoleophilaceae bacterium]
MASADGRPSVVYISYDGATEPLGRSQVVAYLERLAAEFDIRLVSFEKEPRPARDIAERLESAGIEWIPLRYHGRVPLASTAYDLVRGVRALNRALRTRPADIIHTRSYVPTELVLRTASTNHSRLLFDIRGFWVDERVEGGIWRRGLLYRYGKRRERSFFKRADAVVTLTRASVPVIEGWLADRQIPVDVIPTCTDVERFAGTQPRSGGAHSVWMGSLSTWYRFDLAARLARLAGLPLNVFTRETETARAIAPEAADIRSLHPREVAGALHAGDVGLCLYTPGFSRLACAPARLAEYLAAGMPVAVSAGVGDMADIVREEGVGVVIEDEDDDALVTAGESLKALGSEGDARARCREVARRLFDVADGARRYADTYRRLTERT